jgi:hypothetical protein
MTDSAAAVPWWARFLGPPVLWYAHFWLVYLLVEAGCSLGAGDRAWLSVAVTVATVVVAGAIGWLALAAVRRRDRGHRSQLAWLGGMLGVVFGIATVAVGIPALVLPPC